VFEVVYGLYDVLDVGFDEVVVVIEDVVDGGVWWVRVYRGLDFVF